MAGPLTYRPSSSRILRTNYLTVRETFEHGRYGATAGTVQPTTLVPSLWAVECFAGDVISKASMFCETAAAGTAHMWWAFYDRAEARTQADGKLNRLLLTADQGAYAWATNAWKTLSFTASYTVLYPGIYYFGFVSEATTQPQLRGLTTTADFGSAGGVDGLDTIANRTNNVPGAPPLKTHTLVQAALATGVSPPDPFVPVLNQATDRNKLCYVALGDW